MSRAARVVVEDREQIAQCLVCLGRCRVSAVMVRTEEDGDLLLCLSCLAEVVAAAHDGAARSES